MSKSHASSSDTSATSARVARHSASRLLAYAPPYLFALGALALAWTGGWLWGGQPLYAMTLAFAHEGAGVVVWRMTKSLTDVLRLLALACIMANFVFMVLVGTLGFSMGLVSLWAAVGLPLASYWTIRRALLSSAEKSLASDGVSGGSASKLIELLGGAKLGTPKTLDSGAVVTHVEADRGFQSAADLVPIAAAVDSLAGLRPGATRFVASSTDAGAGQLVTIPVDLLQGIVPWRGASAFGASVAEAVAVGTYADMSRAYIWLTGDESVGRNAAQWLIMGMTGAGKSKSMLMVFADLSTRYDFTLWAHDHVKGLQTLKPLIDADAIDWVSMDPSTGKSMLAATRLAIGARARWLGANGYDQWQEGCGLNLLVVWLEEAADFAQLKVLLQLVREGRSAGVIIMLSVQRASHTTIDTDSRSQLSGNICFGVDDATDASFGLPTSAMDNGAAPQRWRADKPGYAYIAAPGIEEAKQAMELRFDLAAKEQIVEVASKGKAVRRPLENEIDQVTVRAAGKDYENRVRTSVFANPNDPGYAKALGMEIRVGSNLTTSDRVGGGSNDGDRPSSNRDGARASNASSSNGIHGVDAYAGSETSGADDRESDDGDREDGAGMVDETEAVNVDAAMKAFQSVSVPALPDVEFDATVRVKKLTTDECRQFVQHYIGALYVKGKTIIGVPDIVKMTPPIDRKREWVRGELNRLAGLAATQPEVNEWRVHTDADMGAGEYRIVAPVQAVGA